MHELTCSLCHYVGTGGRCYKEGCNQDQHPEFECRRCLAMRRVVNEEMESLWRWAVVLAVILVAAIVLTGCVPPPHSAYGASSYTYNTQAEQIKQLETTLDALVSVADDKFSAQDARIKVLETLLAAMAVAADNELVELSARIKVLENELDRLNQRR